MSWFWHRSHHHPRVTSSGGLAHGDASRSARRKTALRIGYTWVSVVVAAAVAGCAGSPGSTGPGRATAAASAAPVFISRTVPDAPVGRQLAWFLRAVADVPWSQQQVRAHFSLAYRRAV